MSDTITIMSDDEKENIISDFLKDLGYKLIQKREVRSLSQEELAICLGISQATLSRYEGGISDMNVSMLPLFSGYCDFPLYELFPKDECLEILKTIKSAVKIVVQRTKRHKKADKDIKTHITSTSSIDKPKESKKQLTGYIYTIDGREVREDVVERPKSMRDQYKDAAVPVSRTPYTDDDFTDYIQKEAPEIVSSVTTAGMLLDAIEDMPKKDTLRGYIADYIIDELIINHINIKEPSESNERLYAYYQLLYDEEMKKSDKPDGDNNPNSNPYNK